MIVKLTARTVDSIKPTPGKRAEYFDTEVPGLALRVTERGAKSWTLMYRTKRGGRLRRLTLGTQTVLSLADARGRARDELAKVRDGADPAAQKHEDRKASTIGELAEDYIQRYAMKRKRSWKADQRMLNAEILPQWGQRAIADISRRDVRHLVNAIAERGAPTLANRTTALLSKVFKFALDDELIDVSPASRIPRPAAEHQRDRVLTVDEIRSLWQSFGTLAPEMAAFYKLRLLTAQRAIEVASMRWVDVDLEAGWWTVPAGVSKNKLAHRVPLAASALAMVKQLRGRVDETNRERERVGKDRREPVYVLENARGKRQQAEAAALFTVTNFRGHDLRRTAASLMAGGGISRLVISKILNHVERSVTAVYDRHSYDAEKASAIAWWDARLHAILENKPVDNVRPFARG